MRFRPLDIPDEHEQAVRVHLDEFEDRLHDSARDVLAAIEEPPARRLVRDVAFGPGEILPKRRNRPTVEIHHLAEQLYLHYADTAEPCTDLLRATLLTMEYYDICDDIVDGDVAEGGELDAFLTRELILSLLVDYVGRLGPDATAHWSDYSRQTVEAATVEVSTRPSGDAYLDLVDRQSNLFGCAAGLGAVAAGADDDAVDRATELGRTYYAYDQFVLDFRQHHVGDDDPWNAWSLLSTTDARAYVEEKRGAFEDHLEPLPDHRQRLLAPLVATDLDEFRETIGATAEAA